MSEVLRAAAESNGNYSSKHAQLLLKRDELKAEQTEVHELPSQGEKRSALEGAQAKVHLTEEKPPIKLGAEVDLPAESMEPEVSPAHQMQMERASKMRLRAATIVAGASAHEEAEKIRDRVMKKALGGSNESGDESGDRVDEMSVVSQLSALREQVGLARTAAQRWHLSQHSGSMRICL